MKFISIKENGYGQSKYGTTGSSIGKEQESGRYGSILNILKISAICFLLDDDLTVLEASNSFYEKTGYSKKEFQTCFQTMRGYYREYPEDWEAIRDRLVYSAENGGADTALNVRMPRKSGGFSWVNISLTLTEKTGMAIGYVMRFIRITVQEA